VYWAHPWVDVVNHLVCAVASTSFHSFSPAPLLPDAATSVTRPSRLPGERTEPVTFESSSPKGVETSSPSAVSNKEENDGAGPVGESAATARLGTRENPTIPASVAAAARAGPDRARVLCCAAMDVCLLRCRHL